MMMSVTNPSAPIQLTPGLNYMLTNPYLAAVSYENRIRMPKPDRHPDGLILQETNTCILIN